MINVGAELCTCDVPANAPVAIPPVGQHDQYCQLVKNTTYVEKDLYDNLTMKIDVKPHHLQLLNGDPVLDPNDDGLKEAINEGCLGCPIMRRRLQNRIRRFRKQGAYTAQA